MKRELGGIGDRAGALRNAFDRSFAEPPRAPEAPPEALLALRVGRDGYALRLGEVAGLFFGKRIAPVPSAVPELLGVVGLRGAVVPAYDMRALLGAGRTEAPRWLVVVAGPARLALAFDALEGHEHVLREAIASETRGRSKGEFVCGMVRFRDRVLPILHLPSIVQHVEELARQAGRHKEQ